jgi:hypothetical protein
MLHGMLYNTQSNGDTPPGLGGAGTLKRYT